MDAKQKVAWVLVALSAGLPSSTVSAESMSSPDAAHSASNHVIAAVAPTAGEAKPRLTQAEEALVAWAQDRFAAAGLDAPSVTVAFTPGPDNCGGFQGRYYSSTETVAVCIDEDASDLVLRTTLLHEMSHAWAHHHLDQASRAAFVELRNTPTWDSWDFAWTDRATEHAAVVMAWGLMDIPTTVRPVGDTSRRALEESFQLLTGVDPINDGSVPSSEPTGLGTEVAAARLS
jgi:hypothetical protein